MNAHILNSDFSDVCSCGAALYQMAPCSDGEICGSSGQMMGYAVRTRDGKLFCIDGGTTRETAVFIKLCRKVSGQSDGPLHVDGWFLTHPHDDHIDVFRDMVLNRPDDFTVDTVYYNMPSSEYQDKYEPHFAYTAHDFEAIKDIIAPFSRTVHAGDSFDFGTVRFDILTEPDEQRYTVNTGNNSSVCIKMTLEGQTVLFLADMGAEMGRDFLSKYGENALRSDFVQMAHHGQNGVEYPVYIAASPKACLWCTPRWLWENDAGGGYGTGPWATFGIRCCAEDLGVKYNFIEKDGIWEIPFPFDFK